MDDMSKGRRGPASNEQPEPAASEGTKHRWRSKLQSSRRKYVVGAVAGGLAACLIGAAAVSGDLPFIDSSAPTLTTTTPSLVTTTTTPSSSSSARTGSGSGSGSGTGVRNGTIGTGSPTTTIPTPVGPAAPPSGSFDAVSCPTTSSCVAVGAATDGSGAIALSSDGGTTWAGQTSPAKSAALTSVSCGDKSHCTAVGSGTVISTSNAGTNWQTDSIPVKNVNLLSISCADGSDCVATGLGSKNPVLAPHAVVLSSQDG